MPEGDTIAAVARLLGPLLAGRRLVAARARDPIAARGLCGRTVTAVEAVGKHLLIGLDDRTTLRVHLGMSGSWHRYDPGERWRFPPHLASLVLETDEDVVVCRTARTVERGFGAPAQNHVRERLGPNVLADDPDWDEMVARTIARPDRTTSAALLDQGVAAGIGNIWRNELLFRHGLHPERPVGTVPAEVWAALWREATETLARSAGGHRDRYSVYGRANRPCRRCGARVLTAIEASTGRRSYWCPSCQRAHEPRG